MTLQGADMKTRIVALALVLAVAGLGLVAVSTPAGAVAACTMSYPGECTVNAGNGVKVHCDGVGAVPDCRT